MMTMCMYIMGTKVAYLKFLVGALLHLIICSKAASFNSSTDESSLLALRSHFMPKSHELTTNWSKGTSFCTWIGVTCSQKHRRVTALDLFNMSIKGTIPPEIGNLSFLTYLDISNNSFSGLIPDEIWKLRRLRVLNIAFNQFSGLIPSILGFLTSLETLRMPGNQLNGSIPQSIFNLSSLQEINLSRNLISGTLPTDICRFGWKLQDLHLSYNQLMGDIPKGLSQCRELKTLYLSYNNFSGSIPMEIGNLSKLQILALGRNKLTGELPSAIFFISSLQTIDASDNQISGNFPTEICSHTSSLQFLSLMRNHINGQLPSSLSRCRALSRLYLAKNNFSGNLPTEFWTLSEFQWINLRNNGFTGIISQSIGNLSNLQGFDFSENHFEGSIPTEIGFLSGLSYLILESNKINGEIPKSIFNLSGLQVITLRENKLSGNLPSFIDLPNLGVLLLSDNDLSGEIPHSISNLTMLTVLEIVNNSFSGYIPTNMGNLVELEQLYLADNQFRNNLSIPGQDFLSSLGNCINLRDLQITGNPISGALPKALGNSNLSASLQKLTAMSCRIQGSIPDEIGNLSSLFWLSLGQNELSGTVPETLGQLKNLQKLEIYQNRLEGSIFDRVCNLDNLYHLNLAENRLTGQIPECLGDMSSLREIYLGNNALNSTIASNTWFNDRIQIMNLSNNFLEGFIPQAISNMKSLNILYFSGNRFSGEIPSGIGRLQSLTTMSLSDNMLGGIIPETFVNLKGLEYLDISQNSLSGVIPKSFERLANLHYFNVSFNELNGEIPDGGPFLNFTDGGFIGNKGLCGASRFKVEACKNIGHSKPPNKEKILKYILPVVLFIAVGALAIILFLRFHKRNSLMPAQPKEPLGIKLERISQYDVLNATNNLDEGNLVGRGSLGSVYKGMFPDNMVAAVKVFNLEVQGALKSFDTECEILRSIRHRNLVKVITSCSSLDFKALVLAYMPNGNLEKCLHAPRCTLGISQRLRVMIDVASAIEYLHFGYSPPIVHCDLKPSNILLDEEMVAHVSDFGISKLLTDDQRMVQTKTIGTFGYIAPEYGLEGIVSTAVDVYSYGILLMETITRMKPTSEMFSEELTMKRWVSESLSKAEIEIVDMDLVSDKEGNSRIADKKCLRSILEIAVKCTMDSPEERPNMKDVLAGLHKIKNELSRD